MASELGLSELSSLPSSPCLSSRVETGIRIDPEDLEAIDVMESWMQLNWNPETEKFVGDHADLANPLRDRTRRPNWREDDLSNS